MAQKMKQVSISTFLYCTEHFSLMSSVLHNIMECIYTVSTGNHVLNCLQCTNFIEINCIFWKSYNLWIKESIATLLNNILLEVSLAVNATRILVIEIVVIFCIRTNFSCQAEQGLIKLSTQMPNFSLWVLKSLGSYVRIFTVLVITKHYSYK